MKKSCGSTVMTPRRGMAGGYDRLQTPRASHRDFPEHVQHVADQVEWALTHIQDNGKATGRSTAVAAAAARPRHGADRAQRHSHHLAQQGDLRSQAIEEKLITMWAASPGQQPA